MKELIILVGPVGVLLATIIGALLFFAPLGIWNCVNKIANESKKQTDILIEFMNSRKTK